MLLKCSDRPIPVAAAAAQQILFGKVAVAQRQSPRSVTGITPFCFCVVCISMRRRTIQHNWNLYMLKIKTFYSRTLCMGTAVVRQYNGFVEI